MFTYAAVGGTNEVSRKLRNTLLVYTEFLILFQFQEWSINLKRVKKHAYTCTIER